MNDARESHTEAAGALALFQRAPILSRQLAWLPLGSFPTAVHAVEVRGRPVLVKRDDMCADGYAGNKVRKLEFLLGAARAAGVTRLITAGATGSHHAFATAFHGTRNGFDVTLVLFPQPLTPHVRDMLLLDASVGAELRWVRRMEAVPYGMWRARIAHRGTTVQMIPPGGSSPEGTLGYVNAGLELADQIEAGGTVRPTAIFVPAGTLGTAAGLAIGLAWAGMPIPVIGTRITSRLVTNERALGTLVRRTLGLLRAAGAEPPDARAVLRLVQLRHDHIGTGYGQETEAGRDAADAFGSAGLRLDTTYTAKAAAALLGEPPGDAPPLFWHTLSAVEPRELLPDGSAAGSPPASASGLPPASASGLPPASASGLPPAFASGLPPAFAAYLGALTRS
jgi:1-aminocyclopropane-1-carboxylate deaminase/D-cysteine desulfhydrase-like pyridoxal-dependent ACC family enzyme